MSILVTAGGAIYAPPRGPQGSSNRAFGANLFVVFHRIDKNQKKSYMMYKMDLDKINQKDIKIPKAR